MRVERFEQAHQLAEGQLITDAASQLWKVFRSEGRMWLYEVGSTGLDFELTGAALGDDAPLPWSTVKVVPDDGLPRTVLSPCPVCGKADWPEGGMHAARSIHLHMHETGELASGGGCPKQRLLWASPPYGPSCLLATGHEGDCEFPATWVDPKTGRTIDVATHGRVTAVRAEGATA